MPADTTAPGAGHRLGPHLLGHRIVVRRLLPGRTGPSGGPAMSDVLGVCTAWGEHAVTVQPENGPAVTIPIGDVVAGKPVPPRRLARPQVSVSARDAEDHALVMWPRTETAVLGDWVLRSDPAPVGRLVKRANSCLAMGDPGCPLPDAEEIVRAYYAERGRRPLAQVELGSEVETALASAGWTIVADADSLFLLTSVSEALRRGRQRNRVDSLLIEADGPRARAWVHGRAEGRAAVDGDWLGLHGLAVRPEHQRHGLGTALMVALLEWGAARGASTAWLHVEVHNAARAWYEDLGFLTHHAYRYLAAPQEGADLRDRPVPAR